uniref:Uncharacterized protein n=1 Tax=Gasterosteus aculeatus aculeatus TaxID=481459 RepID=A0AAQ4S5U5_GASAC
MCDLWIYCSYHLVIYQKAAVDSPSTAYPAIDFQVLNVDHVFLRQATPESSRNSSLKAQTQYVLITGKGGGLPQPAVNASYGPLSVDAPISPDLLLSGRRILPVILVRKVRSSSPVVKILFHMPAENDVTAVQDRAHCVTAYAFWETREVRGACLVLPGGFCVAQLRPEPAWFSSASRSGSASKEAGKTEGIKGLQGNLVEVYFQSRRDRTGQCNPQDSLQRVGVGKGRGSGGSGTPMRRIGSVSLLRTQSGNPTYFRVRLGGAVVIQTSSKPLKDTDIATFYVFLPSTSTLETFTLSPATVALLACPRCPRMKSTNNTPQKYSCYKHIRACVKPEPENALNNLLIFCQSDICVYILFARQAKRFAQLLVAIVEHHKVVIHQHIHVQDSITKKINYELTTIIMHPYVCPILIDVAHLSAQNTDILNTAVLTGETVSVPVKTLAVEADGSVTDVTNYTSCRSTEEDVVKVSERCDYVYVNGKETTGRSRVMLNFTYGFLSAQLEMSVWVPRLPLLIDVADPELSQIKGWRVPVITEEEMRKGRGCMLQYQHSTLRVLTPFIARADDEAPPDPLTGDATAEYFLGPDWQVDVTKLVRSSLKVADPDVARVQDGAVLQGRAVGATTVQVLSPVTSSVLAERSIRVVDDKVSVTQLGVHLVSGLSLSLQLSPGSSGAIVATATTRETITQLKQEAVVSCWVQFSDGTVVPLELFDRTTYSLTVSTPDEGVATVRRTPLSTFLVAQGEGRGQGALVRVEMRICEECQKSKRKSKLAVGTGLVRVNFRSSGRVVAGERGGNKVGADGGKDFDGASESGDDLVATFRAMSDVEIGTYAVVGVTCVAILAVLLKCASNKLCFRGKKTPIQAGPSPAGDPKDHKHDWVWLESNSEGTSAPGAPAQVAPAAPERTATLGRSRNSSQQQHFQGAAMSPMASRSATLLARPQHSEPLHSPTSKRNQVQFTTFTTLDIKHLAALKKNGVDLNWAHQQTLQHQTPAKPQSPLPDMPWVKDDFRGRIY